MKYRRILLFSMLIFSFLEFNFLKVNSENLLVVPHFDYNLSVSSSGDCWYVDNQANGNNNGSNWQNAWQSFNDINWSNINPGDIVYISGGSTEKTYNEQLYLFEVSGNESSPISIMVGQESGHNGKVIITNDGPYGGIQFSYCSYITINGSYNGNQNIIVQDCTVAGIFISNSNHHITLTYLEIYHNGDQSDEDGILIKYNTNEFYPIVEISYSKIHRNYQDQIKALGGGNFANDFGAIIVHDNEIYEIADDGFESGAGGIDFYNNNMHTRFDTGASGHTDGLQFYGEYYRIYNNVFHDFAHVNLSSTSYIYMHTGIGNGNERPSKEMYIFNNLLYEDKKYEIDNSLRGIMFANQENGAISISNIVIVGNTIVGMPATAMTLSFDNFDSDHLDNVTIVNNIALNCYTNGGGLPINIIEVRDDNFIGSIGSNAKIIFDYNILYHFEDNSELVSYNGTWGITQDELINVYGLNVHGINIDLSLDAVYRPDDENDPSVDAGYDLTVLPRLQNLLTNHKLEGLKSDINGILRPQGYTWDIGSYEYDSTQPNINPIDPNSYKPPDDFILSHNAGDPDIDGIFNLTWTKSTNANNFSIYRYHEFITEIQEDMSSLANQDAISPYLISGLTNGTYYFIVVAFNYYGNTLSNCIEVNVEIIGASSQNEHNNNKISFGNFTILFTIVTIFAIIIKITKKQS